MNGSYLKFYKTVLRMKSPDVARSQLHLTTNLSRSRYTIPRISARHVEFQVRVLHINMAHRYFKMPYPNSYGAPSMSKLKCR